MSTVPAPGGDESAIAALGRWVADAAGRAPVARPEDPGGSAQALLDAMPGAVAILDARGRIVVVNAAWSRFMSESPATLDGALAGADYLAVCAHAAAAGESHAAAICRGLMLVLDGRRDSFELEHPCPGPRPVDADRRMMVSARALPAGGAVIAHVESAREAGATHPATLAVLDPLTGLANRAGLTRRLRAATAEIGGAGGLTILFIDLDHFKLINDSLGHEAGDTVLVEVARRLATAVRPTDTVARFGGDEFVVLCEPISDADDGSAIADRIARVLAAPVTVGERSLVVAASIGIATTSETTLSADDLLRDADVALYHAKRTGRNRAALFDGELRRQVLERMEIEDGLRRALERDELTLLHHPVIDLRDGSVVAIESLLRWRHPVRGLLSPTDFLAVAEETGLIVPIGAYVLDCACERIARWRRIHGRQAVQVSVNISGRELRGGIVDAIEAALGRYQLPAGGLLIEVSEKGLVQAGAAALDVLWEIHNLGVGLAVDDFGIGVTSLGDIKRFPPGTWLKIDRSFVAGLPNDRGDAAVIQALVGLAEAVGLVAVAEGIETRAQHVTLRRLGCHLGQGRLFSEAVPHEQLDEALSRVLDAGLD